MLNTYLCPTLAIGAVLFAAGIFGRRWLTTPRRWIEAFAVGGLLAFPAVFHAAHYLHLFDEWIAFYRWRTVTGAELTGGGVGLLAGLVYARLASSRSPLRHLLRAGVIAATVALVAAPWAKQILLPLPDSQLRERWVDGVCLQSTPSTCGPCAAATILRTLGIEVTEADLAHESYSTATGTEVWYLARALRARGVEAEFEQLDPASDNYPVPSVAGVRVGGSSGFGHFVALLGRTPDGLVVGDPLSGREALSMPEFHERYAPTGFFLVILR